MNTNALAQSVYAAAQEYVRDAEHHGAEPYQYGEAATLYGAAAVLFRQAGMMDHANIADSQRSLYRSLARDGSRSRFKVVD